jgi:FkbM family methyltransferase
MMIEFFDLRAEENKHFRDFGLFNLRMMFGRMRRAVDQNERFRTSNWYEVLDYLDSPDGRSEYGFAFASLPSQPNGPVLSIDTGITLLPYAVAEMGWRTLAANPDVAAVQLLQQEGTAIFETKVENYFIDPRSITLSPAQFEVVLATGILNCLYYADIPLAIAEMIRASCLGGTIVLTLRVLFENRVEVLNIFKPLLEDDEASHKLQRVISVEGGEVLLGVRIRVPNDEMKRQQIIKSLREVGQHLPYPPEGAEYQRINTILDVPIWVNNDSIMKNALTYGDFDTRTFEQDVQAFLEKFLRPNDVAFDVGANVGIHTVQMARLLDGQGSVHAFEPAHTTFDCLVRNSLLINGAVNLNRLGLSVENGTLALNKANNGQAALNSYGHPFGSGASTLYESELSWTMTLDEYVRTRELKNVTLIKIDVEGWEERVLRGGLATLLDHKPVLLVELTASAARNANSSLLTINKLLQTLGYELYRYVVNSNTLEALETDRENWRYTNAVAVPRSRLDAVQERLNGGDGVLTDSDSNTNDLKLLLEENRSLRQRLMSGILDREVTLLDQLLQHREADREARLAIIQQLQAEIAQYQAQIKQLSNALDDHQKEMARLKDELEADFSGKANAFEQQIAQLNTQIEEVMQTYKEQFVRLKDQLEGQYAEKSKTYEQQVARLKDQLDALYKDYEARMEVINSLSRTVDVQESHIRAIQNRKIVRLMRRLGRPLA